ATTAPASAAPATTAGQTFLAANAKVPGVVVLPSGLQYKILTSGPKTGPSPKPGDIIKVHYEGKLLDGTVFDSSFARKQSAIMPLEGLVQAWLEALPMMKVGDEWVLYVPPALGYGDRDVGPIPAGSVMTFRLQLLGMLAVD
ncbi:MAG TPA: FKBP-type peptidyl-prolyl cis-trans isomerase, partial [Caulobacter sp.]|nr:FKBP-type peptidyl-prolyl cis-trans isomerase [Caulobacter sp.]